MGNCKDKLEQDEFVNSVVLPSNKRLSIHKGGHVWYKEQFAKIGIMLGEPYKNNDIFSPAILPTGWKIIPAKHAMWSNLLDNLNRKRGSIFYHNKDCNMQLDCRFRIKRIDNQYHVIDYGKSCTIFICEVTCEEEPYYNWLKNKYPDYQDPTKYWDEV